MSFWIIYISFVELLVIPVLTTVAVVVSLWTTLEAHRILSAEEDLYLRTMTESRRYGSGILRAANRLVQMQDFSPKNVFLEKEIKKEVKIVIKSEKRNRNSCKKLVKEIVWVKERADSKWKSLDIRRTKTKDPRIKSDIRIKQNYLIEIMSKLDELYEKSYDLLKKLPKH